MNLGPAGRRSAIEAALLEYQRSPGRQALAGKQPNLLFASVTEILQLASGRSPEGLEEPAPAPDVQGAARFFIRTALLCADADHYALLGLERGAKAAAVKDRYRLMMRLMHPDFAGSLAAGSWPADAASRLNRAYEVLSSAEQRSAYDEQLDAPARPREPARESRPSRSFKAAVPRTTSRDARQSLKRLATVFGAAGAIAALGVLYASVSGEKETLVQRAVSSTARAIAASLPDASSIPLSSPAASAQLGTSPAMPPAPSAPTVAAAPAAPSLATAPAAADASGSPPPAMAPLAVPPPTAQIAEIPVAPAPSQPIPAATPAAPPVPAANASQLAVPPAGAVPLPPPAPDTKPAVNPGVTLAEVHPLLSKLLQRMESGSGDQVLALLDRDARSAPAAQALSREYESLVDGGYPIKVSNVQFRSEPREGRLLVTGLVMLQVGNPPQGGKPFAVQAEFASREGNVVMTRLARAQGH